MASEKLLKVLLWVGGTLTVIAISLLVCIYASGMTSTFNQFQVWSSVGICFVTTMSTWVQLRRIKKK